MQNALIYIAEESEYSKPIRPRGRPVVGSKYTEEEKIERRRISNRKCYYNNHEYYKLYNRLSKQAITKQKKELK